MDKAKREFWDDLWEREPLPPPIDPADQSLGNYPNLRFHDLFTRLFPPPGAQGSRLLEIGCARSAWLPYFARHHGFNVTGIDYSESGCAGAREILDREGAAGEVVCADFRDPPRQLFGAFDMAVSFGVVEHFTDTEKIVGSLCRFLAPGGVLVTIIPNLAGLVGKLMRLVDPADYSRHIVLTGDRLAAGHRAAGLERVACEPFLSANLCIVKTAHLRPRPLGTAVRYFFWWASKAAWAWERRRPLKEPPPSRAPYLVCRGERPPERNP